MGGESRARIVGPWPAIARVRAALSGAARPGLMVLAAPAGVPRAALADASARGQQVLAYVTGLTAVHAAALFIAGVDGFATRLADLPHAATGVIDRRLHLEPMSALAVLHLARSVRDPAFDPLAAAARACAAGQPWPPFNDADDLAAAAQHLRRRLLSSPAEQWWVFPLPPSPQQPAHCLHQQQDKGMRDEPNARQRRTSSSTTSSQRTEWKDLGGMRRILGAVLRKTVAVAGPASAVTVNLAIKRLRAGLPRRMISVLVRVGVVIGAAAVILPSGAAQALGGFHTSGNSVRVRAAASTQASQVSFIPAAGTAIDIACQTAGQTVSLPGWGTSPIWDKLNGYGGGYISDLFVRETPYARFDPRLPQCGASPPPAASNQAPAGLGGGVNMQSACNAQYPGQGLTATATDSNNAYSWKCVGSGVSRGIDVASQCRAQYGAGAVAAVANPASAWSWYCYTPASSSGEACVFNDPRLFSGLAGHVGWGFELPGGNWEFGANEGPKNKAGVSNTVAYTGSEATMLAWFINGGYARYRCVTVPAFNASAAEQQVSKEQNERYVPPSSDCESQTDNVLREYGVKNLPNDVLDPLPNDWFNALSGAGFGGPTSL